MYQPIERTTKVMLDLENIVIYEDVPQRSDLWFKLRSGHLTASNFDRLITPKTGKPSAQQDDLIIELCCSCLRPDEMTFEGNFHTDRGEALEQEARELFATLTGKAVKEVGFIRRKTAPIGCSPDGLVVENLEDGLDLVIAGLEIKCPISKHHARYLLDGVLPDKYKPQVHGSMAVTGLRAWYFLSYCPGLRPFLVKVEWDEYTDRIKAALDEFGPKYLDAYTRIMPAIRPAAEGRAA